MKTIKDLTVKVTYTVGLSNVQVSDEVYEALSNCYDKGGEVDPDSLIMKNRQLPNGYQTIYMKRMQWIGNMT